MTANGLKGNSDDNQPATEQGVATDAWHQTVTLADVLAVQQGNAIAVRAAQELIEWILSGGVTSFADDAGTSHTAKQRLQESTSTIVLSIDADTWWALSEGDTIDRSYELDDRPQMQDYLDMPPKIRQRARCPTGRPVASG